MKTLASMVTEDRILILDPAPKREILDRLLDAMGTSDNVTDPAAFSKAVWEREKDLSTGIGQGLAIPHAKIPQVKDFTLAFALCRQGIDFDSFDNHKVHYITMIASHSEQASEYIKVLARVVNLFKEEENRRAILQAATTADIYNVFQKF